MEEAERNEETERCGRTGEEREKKRDIERSLPTPEEDGSRRDEARVHYRREEEDQTLWPFWDSNEKIRTINRKKKTQQNAPFCYVLKK